jgi:hypothetical protein
MDYDRAVGNSVNVKGYQYNENTFYLKRVIRDIEKDTVKHYLCPYLQNGTSIAPFLPSTEITKVDIDASDLSSSINVKMVNSSDGKCFIEIFSHEILTHRIDASDSHEKVIGDEWFGGTSFSPNGRFFVYVAGKRHHSPHQYLPSFTTTLPPPLSLSGPSLVPKKDKITSFFDAPGKMTDSLPNKYRYDEDWGEKYEGISRLGLFLLDLQNGIIKEVPGISANETVGQPVFTPCSQGIIYTTWIGSCRKMGMIYCFQRPCELRLVLPVDGIMQADPPVESTDSASGDQLTHSIAHSFC